MSTLELDLRATGSGGFRLDAQCTLPGKGVTALYGPSGCGKTTLLDCIAGLRDAEPGSRITVGEERWLAGERDVPSWERGIGYVFQDGRLFTHLDVRGNLAYAQQRARREAVIGFEDAVSLLGLDTLLDQRPDTLSAGQKQRVAIARALLSAPRLLLLDEPLANLDHAASRQCLACLQSIAARLQLPILYVSHDIEEVSEIADHLLLLDDGRIAAQGALLDLCSRLDSRLTQQEQAAAIVTAEVSAHDEDFGLTQLSLEGEALWVTRLPRAVGDSRRVRIPARDVSLCRARPSDSSILNILPVTISELGQEDGARLMVRLAIGSQFLLARITRRSAAELSLKVGEPVFAQIKSVALLMEAADTA